MTAPAPTPVPAAPPATAPRLIAVEPPAAGQALAALAIRAAAPDRAGLPGAAVRVVASTLGAPGAWLLEQPVTGVGPEVVASWPERAPDEIGALATLTHPLPVPAGEPERWLVVLHTEHDPPGPADLAFVEAVGALIALGLSGGGATDALTGLAGRPAVETRLRSAAAGGAPAVVVADLDRYGELNSAFGHAVGDELLAEVARRLRGVLPDGALAARLAGDVFAIVPPDPGGERAALRCAEAVTAALAEPLDAGGRDIWVTASIGVAAGGGMPPATLLRDADDALRRAKRAGGGRCELAEPAQAARRAQRLVVEGELRHALERGELELYYQPIVTLEDGAVSAMEALLRWNHPRRGVLAPAEFLAVAEAGGLIGDIGRWALRQACRQAARWADDPTLHDAVVAVNVSGRQLADPAFADEVRATLAQTGVPPQRLLIELTETVLMERAAGPVATIQRLREAGVRVALDDFGTGYSSLGLLRSLPIDTLKVDRAFVAELLEDAAAAHVLGAVVQLARALDLTLVAEGVEREEQLLRLGQLGCTAAQGFLFSRPLTAGAAEDLLRQGLGPAVVAVARRAAGAAGQAPALTPASGAADGAALTLSQACDALGVSMSTLRRWADSGRIRVVRTAGGHRRFPASEIRRLNRTRGSQHDLAVRPVPPPDAAAPAAARAFAPALAGHAVAAVYHRSRPGWFAGDAASTRLRQWLAALSEGCAGGDYGPAMAATERLLADAALGGTSALERDRLLERVFELAARAMAAEQAPREELMVLGRLGRALRQRGLALADSR